MNTVPVLLRIRRTSGWQEYEVWLSPDAYVMDALEAAGAQDGSLLYRHSCHHASCGSCGVRMNGREGLPCIIPLKQFTADKRALRVEPLRNFPLLGDLLVDLGPFMRKLDSIDLPPRRNAEPLLVVSGAVGKMERIQVPSSELLPPVPSSFKRLENCIECGLCVSACPVVGLDAQYAGPAMLAAAGRILSEPRQREAAEILRQVDVGHGVWRCHAAFECSEVCPANVDPAREIMSLRRRLLQSTTGREPSGKAWLETHSQWFEPRFRPAGMLAFMLHRLSGIGLVAYLFLHLALLNQLRQGPGAWSVFLQTMRSPWVLFLDGVLLFGILIHGLNGLRVTLVGFGVLLQHHRLLFWTCLGLALILTAFGLAAMK